VLEWLQSGAASRRGDMNGLLLECGGLDCCVFCASPGSGVEETRRASPTDVPYRAKFSLTGLVAIAAR
jgi:hypothetical protein